MFHGSHDKDENTFARFPSPAGKISLEEFARLREDLPLTEYTAPRPAVHWAKIILARTLFPPILLWDGIKFGVNYFAGKKISKEILPRQIAQSNSFYDDLVNHYINVTRLSIRKIIITTHDGAKIDTLQVSDTNGIPQKDQKYIINFPGNGESYEDLIFEMEDDARELKCNVIGFNFRGVMNSRGKVRCANDLVTDGIAQVQRLIDEGVEPGRITLKGFSLGAGIATLVARHFHENGLKINIFSGRSFSSLTNVIVGWIRSGGILKSGHIEPLGWRMLGSMAKPLIKFGLVISKWEIEADRAYKELPDTHKEYMVIRSSKADRLKYGSQIIDDPVITHYASIHVALKSHSKGLPKEVLNQRKMYLADDHRSENAHNTPMNMLRDRYMGCNANTFFRNFVRRTGVPQQHQSKGSSIKLS